MLKGIKRIKGLGVFGDYSQPPGTDEFRAKNIIYGWNYSGKTTLSRVFAHLERGEFSSDLAGYSFVVESDAGQVTEASAKTSGLVVRVFNSDFIHENLNFAGSTARPILLLGSESEEAQKRIGELLELRKRINQAAAKHEKKRDDANRAMADMKKKAAAAIKEALQLTEIYTATQLERDFVVLRLGVDCKLTPEQLESDTKLAHTSDELALPALPKIDAGSSLPELWAEAAQLLVQKPEMANAIEYLTQNAAIARWIEAGLPLHAHKESCEFCGNPLSALRFKELRDHFSKDQAQFKGKLESLLRRVSDERLAFSPASALSLNAQFRDRYTVAADAAKLAAEAHDKLVARLEQEVREKIGAPFAERALEEFDQAAVDAWIKAGEALDEIIGEHNELAQHFKAEKREAIKRARLHYVQAFDEKANLDSRVAARNLSEKHIDQVQKMGRESDKQRQELEATISQSQKQSTELKPMAGRIALVSD